MRRKTAPIAELVMSAAAVIVFAGCSLPWLGSERAMRGQHADEMLACNVEMASPTISDPFSESEVASVEKSIVTPLTAVTSSGIEGVERGATREISKDTVGGDEQFATAIDEIVLGEFSAVEGERDMNQ